MTEQRSAFPERRAAVVALVVGAVAFALTAALLVPWHPYPGSRVTPVPESDVLTPAVLARADAYAHAAHLWSWATTAVVLLVALWWGLGRTGRRLAARAPGPWWVQVAVVAAGLVVVRALVALPGAVAVQRLRRRYGLSGQPWSGFARDQVVGLLLAVVVTALGVLILTACVRRFRRTWPLVAGGLAVALTFAGSFVYPVVVEPLFTQVTPLADGPLRDQIMALARVEGVDLDDVLVADASRRTTSLNAYVSGYGSSRRVVLYDTTVSSLSDAEIDAVVAHELGHAAHDDVLTGTVVGAGGALAGIGLLAVAAGALRRRGYPGLDTAAGVPLLLALVALGSFLALPIENGLSRQIETRADVASLEATHDPEAFVAMQRQLAARALADPDPPAWAQWWFGSHPTAAARIALARRIG